MLCSRVEGSNCHLVTRIVGPNINRRTVENVARSGLKLEQVTDLAAGIFKLIEARKLPPK